MARLQSQRDTPNSAREYETIYILRPNTPNEGVAEVNTKVKAVIEGLGGKIVKVDNWGKRRLAYEVAKERCDDLKGNDKDACVKDAKAAEARAKADAKAHKG